MKDAFMPQRQIDRNIEIFNCLEKDFLRKYMCFRFSILTLKYLLWKKIENAEVLQHFDCKFWI